MENQKYLSIAEFAEKAKVSKQNIYKAISNPNSKLFPYIKKQGKRTLIAEGALWDLYGVEKVVSTDSTEKPTSATAISTDSTADSTAKVEKVETETSTSSTQKQPFQPQIQPKIQPISTDYIEYLKAQIVELKQEKVETEARLTATIREKDGIIQKQAEEITSISRRFAEIADKALIATSQQQVLTAMDKGGKNPETALIETPPPQDPIEEPAKKVSFWKRIFG